MTIFGKIIAREVKADIVYENDYVIAFKDINPLADVHILVVPKKEIVSLNDIAPKDSVYIENIFKAIPKIAEDMGIKESYRIGANCGKIQEVKHLHFHLLGEKC